MNPILKVAVRVMVMSLLIGYSWTALADKPKKTRVAVFLIPAKGYKPKLVAKISRIFVKALRKNPAIDVEDADKLLLQYSGEIPLKEIAQAEKGYALGMEQLKSRSYSEAITTLEQAVYSFEQVLAFVKKRTLAQTFMALAVAQAEARKTRQAQKTMTRLLTWRPQFRYDTEVFSARHLPLFTRARAAVKRNKRGSVELITKPPGAKAYMDGRFMGVTPSAAFGLKIGTHYATFKKTGFVKAALKIAVNPNRQAQYEQSLKRSGKYLLLKEALANAARGLGQSKANTGMKDLRSVLFIDQAVFATIGYAGPGKIHVSAYLYDLRSMLRLNKTTRNVNQRTLAGMKQMSGTLYRGVRLDGDLVAPPEPPPPPQKKRTPLYAAWWFWTAIGAGIATAILVPYFTWPESDTIPGGYHAASFNK